MTAERLGSLLVTLVMAMATTGAFAQDDYPSRAIRVIVPFTAGGLVDVAARSLTEKISHDWNKPFVIETKPGADGNIGTALVAKSAPDGYTWLVTGPAILTNPSIRQDLGWNVFQDFKCVGVVLWTQTVAIVRPGLPVNSMKELVDYAKANPGRINFGNPGNGSSVDLIARKLFKTAGIEVTNIGYKGQPPALNDLLGSHIDFGIFSAFLALPHIQAGTVKPIAVFSREPIAAMPGIPTIAQAGYADAAYVPWFGVYVPAATPQPVVERIHAAINDALNAPEVRERLAQADIPGTPMALSELAALVKSDHDDMLKVIRESGIEAQ